MEDASANYRRLDRQKIIETVEALRNRIERRFPGSGLSKVLAELLRSVPPFFAAAETKNDAVRA